MPRKNTERKKKLKKQTLQHAGITVIMESNMHSCHSTETMPWLVIFTDQSTSQLSPCALLKSSCSQWTLRHEKAVDVATMSISQSVRRSDPQSILFLRGQKREVFALSTTYPLIEVLLKKNRSIWHPLLEKKSSQSQGKGHCQLLPKDWKTASHALTGDPLAPQQPPVAMGRPIAENILSLGLRWCQLSLISGGKRRSKEDEDGRSPWQPSGNLSKRGELRLILAKNFELHLVHFRALWRGLSLKV